MGGYNPGRGFETGSPFNQNRRGRLHKGVDFPAAHGTPIPAAADGVVVGRGEHEDFGWMVIVQHHDPASANVKLTLYAHMPNLNATPEIGASVTKGQQVGTVGSTGRSTGPHLHFELISLPPDGVPWSTSRPYRGGSTGIAGSTGRIDPLNDTNWGAIDVYRDEASSAAAGTGGTQTASDRADCFVDVA